MMVEGNSPRITMIIENSWEATRSISAENDFKIVSKIIEIEDATGRQSVVASSLTQRFIYRLRPVLHVQLIVYFMNVLANSAC